MPLSRHKFPFDVIFLLPEASTAVSAGKVFFMSGSFYLPSFLKDIFTRPGILWGVFVSVL